MDDGQKEVIRTALEMQFRYKFYQDTTFPYLQSLGIKDVFVGGGLIAMLAAVGVTRRLVGTKER
jgi:hypothetical protein